MSHVITITTKIHYLQHNIIADPIMLLNHLLWGMGWGWGSCSEALCMLLQLAVSVLATVHVDLY